VLFQEKRSVVYLISDVVVSVVYCLIVFQKYEVGVEVFRFWGAVMLIFIPVNIVARIINHIILSIINAITSGDEEPSFNDELDKLIELKSTRNSFSLFGIGFVFSMLSLVIGKPPETMFILMLFSLIGAVFIGDISQFYFCKRGV